MALDRNQIREWRKAYLEHNRDVLEEDRSATLAERWHAIYQVEEMRKALSIPLRDEDVSNVRERWLSIKRKFDVRT